MDQGRLADWQRAVRICTSQRPLLARCWAARNALYPDRRPAGVIWAGTAYTGCGRPLTTQRALVEYASDGNRGRQRESEGGAA